MKMSTLIAVGALATGTLAAVPAEAQRYGYDYDSGDRGDSSRHHRDDDRGYGYRGYEGYRGYGYRGYDDGDRRGYDRRGDHGWHRGYHGRPRVTCRIVRGYYGPERRCFRAF